MKHFILNAVLAALMCTGGVTFALADTQTAALSPQQSADSQCKSIFARMPPEAQNAYKPGSGRAMFNAFCGRYINGGNVFVMVSIQKGNGSEIFYSEGHGSPTPHDATFEKGTLTWGAEGFTGSTLTYNVDQGPAGLILKFQSYRNGKPNQNAESEPLRPMF